MSNLNVPLLSLALAGLLATSSSVAFGGVAAESWQPYAAASGLHENDGTRTLLMDERVVRIAGAQALRLSFAQLDLGPEDYLDLVSMRDGFLHRITPGEANKWSATSAYLNGDAVLVQLYVAPASRAGYAIDRALVDFGAVEVSLCGDDDRVPSSDLRVGRIRFEGGQTGCTAWVAGPDSCFFTAGHCMAIDGVANVVEFGVPSSLTTGAVQHPAPEFQFPVQPGSLLGTGSGSPSGDDWAVGRLLTNHLGEPAAAKLGFFELGFFDPAPGDAIRVTGHGTDNGADNRTNQTSTGPLESVDGEKLSYTVDTTPGNSGSPVIDEATGRAVGVHTHGGCFSGTANFGTSLTHPGLVADWQATCPEPSAPPLADFALAEPALVAGQTAHFDDLSTGGPSSFAWDFDGDGVTDTTVQRPGWTFAEAGDHDVRLTAANAFGAHSVTKTVSVAPVVPALAPYAQAFPPTGLPASGEWVFWSPDHFGRAHQDASEGLLLDSWATGQDAVSEARLHIDTPWVGYELNYRIDAELDELDPEDGLWVSDGTTEYQAAVHHGPESSRSVNLWALATMAGFDVDAPLVAIFRQRDNHPWPTDGHRVTELELAEEPFFLDQSATSVSVVNGGSVEIYMTGGPSKAGHVHWLLGTLSNTSPGTTLGGVDVPLNPDVYFNYTLSQPNSPPLSNSLGLFDGDGEATAVFTMPPGQLSLVGASAHYAFLSIDPLTLAIEKVSNFRLLKLTP